MRILQVRVSESPECVRRGCKVGERKSELSPRSVMQDAPKFMKQEIEISCSHELRITGQQTEEA